MKVIFLDFDGVLNGLETNVPSSPIHPLLFLSPPLVARVNQLVMRTGAVVVLSTSWRTRAHHAGASEEHLSIDELREALRLAGFEGEVIGVTPDLATEDWIGRTQEMRARHEDQWARMPRHRAVPGIGGIAACGIADDGTIVLVGSNDEATLLSKLTCDVCKAAAPRTQPVASMPHTIPAPVRAQATPGISPVREARRSWEQLDMFGAASQNGEIEKGPEQGPSV